MQLKYGAYPFDANGVVIATDTRVNFNRAEQVMSRTQQASVSGYLSGSGQSDLSTKENQLRAALAIPYKDLIFYRDDGQPSSISLINRGSISGVLIVHGPNFPGTQGNEFSTQRAFNFVASAEYTVSGANNLLVAFEESVAIMGGGPIYRHLPAINGPAQRQLIFPQVPYRVIQYGRAIGYLRYPTPPSPLFPGDLMKAPEIQKRSPERKGGGYVNWEVTWQYEMESVSPLSGTPNLWR